MKKPTRILDVKEYQEEFNLLVAYSLKKVLFANVFDRYRNNWYINRMEVLGMLIEWNNELMKMQPHELINFENLDLNELGGYTDY